MPGPLLVVTVAASSTAELRRRRDEVGRADLVELRLDSVCDPDAAGALADRRHKVIVTCRPLSEGGSFRGSEEERKRLLADALALGADYVDIESRAGFDDLITASNAHRVVLSLHDFNGVPSDLAARDRDMRSKGAFVVKIAVKANRLCDCLPLLALARSEPSGKPGSQACGRVLVAMGEAGLATRVLPERFGSRWAYAGDKSDLGQLTPSALVDGFRFKEISASTSIYGVVGRPVSQSVSPAMHNAAFRAARLDAAYIPLAAADAGDFVTFANALGLSGASITTPFKVTLFDRVDEADTVARRIGAINTIRAVDGRWLGTNTDASGFLRPLQDLRTKIDRVAVLGAGGAARAVVVALGSMPAQVTVHARRLEEAERVASLVGARARPWPPEPGSWDLLVNCTPVGMHPNAAATPVPAKDLTGECVYDLVYNPPVTRLLADAERAGLQTIGGLDMLVGQAEEQFFWWTGVRPSTAVMREAALERLAGIPMSR